MVNTFHNIIAQTFDISKKQLVLVMAFQKEFGFLRCLLSIQLHLGECAHRHYQNGILRG